MAVYQAIIEIDSKATEYVDCDDIKSTMDKLIADMLDTSGTGILLGSTIDKATSPISIEGGHGT